MRTRLWLSLLGLSAAAVVGTGCKQASDPAQSAQPPVAQATPVGTIKELMEGIVDPASDVLFESVATVTTAEKGVQEMRPETDEDWAKVEHNALMLAEMGNLLRVPGRKVANPGDVTTSGAEDSPELPPEQIQALIDKDQALWVKHTDELRDVSLKALKIARAHNAEGLFEVGGELDAVCERCHLDYWYPPKTKEKASLHIVPQLASGHHGSLSEAQLRGRS